MKHKRNHYIFYCIIGLMIFLSVYEELKSCRLIEGMAPAERMKAQKKAAAERAKRNQQQKRDKQASKTEKFTDEEKEQLNKNVSDVVSLRKNVCKKADLVELDKSLDKLNEKMLTVKQKADDKKQKSGQRIS